MSLLIAIDGVDGSGKQTQTQMIAERLLKEGKDIKKISFPAYENESSTLVKMYLNGKFGEKPSDVNAYATSVLFATDRFATYRTDWGKDYKRGSIIIADRYVSSNMIHQASKIENENEKAVFLEWLDDFEHNKLELPRPDVTIFLDMPVEYGIMLTAKRANKIDGSDSKDIHESDRAYLEKSYNNALYVAEKFDWNKISCVKDGAVRSIEEIHNDIYSVIKGHLK